MSTTTTDAQTWVFPPAGAATPPVAETGNFGPIHLGDSIVLEWLPPTQPEIDMTCISMFGDYTNSVVAKLASPPVTYEFLTAANAVNNSDNIFCHLFFNPSVLGNSVTWQFINQVSDKAVTWSAGVVSSTSSSSTATIAPASSSSQSTSASPTASSSANSSSLPTGAKAGISIGVVALVAILATIILLFYRRRRQHNAAGPSKGPSHGPFQAADMRVLEKSTTYKTSPVELDGREFRPELPED